VRDTRKLHNINADAIAKSTSKRLTSPGSWKRGGENVVLRSAVVAMQVGAPH
jgi:hypothetical protein